MCTRLRIIHPKKLGSKMHSLIERYLAETILEGRISNSFAPLAELASIHDQKTLQWNLESMIDGFT